MAEPSRLEELLDIWQNGLAAGRDVPVSELCRTCPDLAGELERRIRAVRSASEMDTPIPPPGGLETPAPSGSGTPRPAWVPRGVGDQVGGFRLVRLLGEGGMGLVFEAEDVRLPGRRVALKMMHAHVAVRPEARERFLHEARAMAQLQHDHIVPLYQVDEEGGVPFLVMPLLAGQSLDRRLHEGPSLTLREALRVGWQTASALAAAHALDRVHRDIKPGNLWLETLPTGTAPDPWRVKVLDFGLARSTATDGLTPAGAVLGTPGYMAPEQAVGHPADGRSDLFSLGCVLYQLLAGRPPFQGSTLTALLLAVVSEDPTPLDQVRPDLPEGLARLIAKLLAKDPARRPESAQATEAVLRSFETALGGSLPPGTIPTAFDPTRPRRASKGFRVWLGAGLAALACILSVTAAIVWWPRTPTPGPYGQSVPLPTAQSGGITGTTPVEPVVPQKTAYHGAVRVQIERPPEVGALPKLFDLTYPRVLPMRRSDKFRIDAHVEPPAYLYLVWVDPGKDVTPLFPWNPEVGWGSRPVREQATAQVSLPGDVGLRFTAPEAKPGVATIVLLARETPLDQPDDVVRAWFEALPDLPLPPGGERGVLWFDNYAPVTDDRSRAGTLQVARSDDPFADWQGQLQRAVGTRAAFQTAISFARKDTP